MRDENGGKEGSWGEMMGEMMGERLGSVVETLGK